MENPLTRRKLLQGLAETGIRAAKVAPALSFLPLLTACGLRPSSTPSPTIERYFTQEPQEFQLSVKAPTLTNHLNLAHRIDIPYLSIIGAALTQEQGDKTSRTQAVIQNLRLLGIIETQQTFNGLLVDESEIFLTAPIVVRTLNQIQQPNRRPRAYNYLTGTADLIVDGFTETQSQVSIIKADTDVSPKPIKGLQIRTQPLEKDEKLWLFSLLSNPVRLKVTPVSIETTEVLKSTVLSPTPLGGGGIFIDNLGRVAGICAGQDTPGPHYSLSPAWGFVPSSSQQIIK